MSSDCYGKIFSVNTKKLESLADFVKRIRREKDLSTTDVELRSRRGGAKGISNGYISQIENNYIQNVSPEKLKALAIGLGEPEETIFAVARGTNPDEKKFADARFENMALKFSGLPATKKERAEALIEMLDRELERLANEK
jgi:transcriptional regulator with XRE-family HTH domain